MIWAEFLALRRNILRQRRDAQDFDAWLHDRLDQWQAVPKPPIDDEDRPEQTAGLARARTMRAKLLASEPAG